VTCTIRSRALAICSRRLSASLAAEPALRENLGCPTTAVRDAPASTQPYDNGIMFWADLGSGGKKIYRFWNSYHAPGRPLVGQIHDDTWTTNNPVDYGLTPPAGHYAPQRGFGLLWISNKFVRQDMGWPTASERAARAVVQQFVGGAALWLQGSDKVYVLGPQSAAHAIAHR
jgi:hypothetical protein